MLSEDLYTFRELAPGYLDSCYLTIYTFYVGRYLCRPLLQSQLYHAAIKPGTG